MTLYIGENIKRLRLAKGITQEVLAERMNVTAASVSKWERGESMPDISLVLPLAGYFGVTADDLLGLGQAKTEEKIRSLLDEYHRLGAVGKTLEKFDLMARAYEEFPNDFRIVEEYMWQLNYDPRCTEAPWGNEVHREELYRLCSRVLTECTLDSPRYSALSILGGLYVLDGETDKAIETAGRLPHRWHCQEEELENTFERGSDPWWPLLRENIFSLTGDLQVKLRNAALYSPDGPAEQIRLLTKAVTLIGLIHDEGDYGFFHYDLGELHIWIANRYVLLGEYEKAFDHYETGLSHAKVFQELPRITVHTSAAVRGKVQDMTVICAGSAENEVARELGYITSCKTYRTVKDMPRMREILEKYRPYAGMRTDYSKTE